MSATTGLTGPPQPPPKTVRQEVAPKGGYAPINVARNVPKSIGGSAGLLLVGTAAMMSYGFYKVGTFNVKRRMLRQEKKEVRFAITPLLQAEEDVRFVAQRKEYHEWEADVMKDVPGWEVGKNVYKTRNFVPPTPVLAPYKHD
ncbi:GRIM-19 superfamily protein, accessory subunit of the mitochondrial membrane respiratory chain NADH dehydrogenase, involved in animal cell death programs [Chondrus crispus]|uniref:NADH dehydrogenase [ubiquinone] 1 alpha subcomplex subunit 13 n=1 Tax=Chondrus crispus TaxID=2769 RepID=R7Q468_CHOCR|nr:GRIM-19 superfamily protein, accessory subunit of the mitochondrial membrane respiratory chain NADH dehydrogenase, involved in animal cell death programs [Chondrus crispus]CDF32270.1 GRIM-19 superfamily protein, accessory subunit of the mitochondrial membrane respiratory chain NADH dehydrogenase, involved in animal cell death programs [Chondrus crispus]|eukprot:XP_005711935.1 GRIM-19 superfamily protein, accessory subunit of the mitochondrial membrane respiratory chain NADH dehydrogenase, involved in animal cell death programs [Chondrus crispus]